MYLTVKNGGVHVQQQCAMCGEWFTLGAAIVLVNDGDDEVGYLCAKCYQGGAIGLAERARERAERLRAQADWLEDAVSDGITYPERAAWFQVEHTFASSGSDKPIVEYVQTLQEYGIEHFASEYAQEIYEDSMVRREYFDPVPMKSPWS